MRRKKMARTLTFLLAILLLLLVKGLDAKRKMFNIFWNTTNPMFRIDNTDNIIDINEDNLPWEYDQANIICPSYPEGTREADMERYIIYSVSRSEYENCRIVTPNPKVIAVCNAPQELVYVTITFRSFTPTPGSLEFKPGKDYFFISTSSRSDLHRRIGGRCSTSNMKVMLRVAKSDREAFGGRDRDSTTVNVPRHYGSQEPRPKNFKDSYPIYHEVLSDLDSNSVEHQKRSEDYDVVSSQHHSGVKQASVVQSGTSKLSANSMRYFAICIGLFQMLMVR